VFLPCFRFLSQILLINLSQSSLVELRMQLSERLLRAPLRQLEAIGAARLLATLTSDIGMIVDALMAVPVLLMHATLVLSCFAYLGWLDWRLLLEVVAVTVASATVYQLAVRKAVQHFLVARGLLDEVVSQIRGMIEGTKELKMNAARRAAFLSSMDASTRALQSETRLGQKIFAASSSWGQVLFFVVIGSVVFVLPRFQPVPTTAMIGYTIVLFQLMAPLEILLNAFPGLSRAAAALRAVEALGLSLEEEAVPAETASLPLAASWGCLELRGVTHGYLQEGQESFILGPVETSLWQSQTVFLVGGNGSGKTTLAKLLMGLYAPEEGEIHFAGRPISDDNREWYRGHFSVVFSDFFLFERLLGHETANVDADVRRYLPLLQLDRKVQVENGVLSTIQLSQGQRKRLALLTAYLEDRPIYLFDEWAADQDPQFKEVFYRELLPDLKKRGKTIFVITHDDRYFHLADRIIKLDNGRIESDEMVAPVVEFDASVEAHRV
jgi:putative ATP-binding cassette transporter